MAGRVQEGKLPSVTLQRLLARIPTADPSVLLGPSPGEDAAALAVPAGESLVIATTDPITFATQNPGWYAVHINGNDIATRGATPRWFLATILLPPTAEEDLPTSILDDIIAACRELQVSLVGGHTEVTSAVTRPTVVGAMLGTASLVSLRHTGGAKPGDRLVLTQGIAIEGTAIVATSHPEHLTGDAANVWSRAVALLRNPGISVVAAARIATRFPGVHAMHDPTEGGLATAVHEMCDASGTDVSICADDIVLPETAHVCGMLDLDPLGLLASGALLISVAETDVQGLLDAYARATIPATAIGTVHPRGHGRTLTIGSHAHPLPTFSRDELARYFSSVEHP